MGGEPERTNKFESAREVYAAFLRDEREGKGISLDALCDLHPEIAADLRKLNAGYQLGRSASLSRSFHESIREHFGDVPEVTVALSADGSAEVTAQVASAGAIFLRSDGALYCLGIEK